MLSHWKWLIIRYSRLIWVRAFLFALVGIVSALIAVVITPFMPIGWASKIGADAIDNILGIMASSMLVVATFSLSTMVAAYAAASTATTPRAVQLLMADTRVQNAIATFIGGFLYSLVGIIALSTDLYGESGRIVLFFVTILMAVVIVVTFIRSIDHVSRLGRVGDAIDRVAKSAIDAMADRHANPWLGGRPSAGRPMPDVPIYRAKIGYIAHLDMKPLQEVAEEMQGEVHVQALPGHLIDPTRPVAFASFEMNDEQREKIQDAFSLSHHRSFDQDPRFGIVVLSEIASKALSPGVNDPGTAIEVIGALTRVLAHWCAPLEEPEMPFDRVYVPGVQIDDVFEDAFFAIANYGAGSVPVGIRLQKALATLSRMGDENFKRAAQTQSELALARAREQLTLPGDTERLAKLAVTVSA